MRETDYPLNPDAAEFVPLSPTSSKKSFDADENPTSPLTDVTNEVRKLLLNDEIVASSPLKGQEKSLDAIDVPSLNDFASEIRKRPSNIMPDFDSDSESHEADNETGGYTIFSASPRRCDKGCKLIFASFNHQNPVSTTKFI